MTFFFFYFFFFNDPATTEIYTLSLHDALPIYGSPGCRIEWTTRRPARGAQLRRPRVRPVYPRPRSEEHTSELQSHVNLVCRLLLEKKNKTKKQKKKKKKNKNKKKYTK